MSREGLRFLHLANAWLDRPLSGTAAWPDELEPVAGQATLTAFQRAVAAAVDRRVDFVLLAGNTFDESDASLAARVALSDGLRKLAEQGIPVFAVPGEADPQDAWREIPGLPDNVRLLGPETRPGCPVERDGELLTHIRWMDAGDIPGPDATPHPAFQPASPTPFVIGLSPTAETPPPEGPDRGPVDYLALGGRGERRTVRGPQGLVHHPGGLQGLGPEQTGPHGATLVEVEAGGRIECHFIPAAPVRWERFRLDVDDRTGREDLIDRMRTALREREPETGEDVWLIRWDVHGGGPLWTRLGEEACQKAVTQQLDRAHSTNASLTLCHGIVLRPDLQQVKSGCAGQPLAEEYFDELAAGQPLPDPESMRPASPVPDGDHPWPDRLRGLAAELDHEAIVSRAGRLGLAWFGASSSEDPAHEDP